MLSIQNNPGIHFFPIFGLFLDISSYIYVILYFSSWRKIDNLTLYYPKERREERGILVSENLGNIEDEDEDEDDNGLDIVGNLGNGFDNLDNRLEEEAGLDNFFIFFIASDTFFGISGSSVCFALDIIKVYNRTINGFAK